MDEELKKIIEGLGSKNVMEIIKKIKSEDRIIFEFTEKINARPIGQNDVLYGIVRRKNYFILNDNFLIVKRSEGGRWWGVKKKYIELLNEWGGKFYLVLLINNHEGYVYSKNEINNNIEDGTWRHGQNKDYNIYPAVTKDIYSFMSHKQFLKKIGIETI